MMTPVAPVTVTVELTEYEQMQINALAHERGLDAPADVLRALLYEAISVNDALWDAKFAASQDALERIADEAHQEYLAGQTEDFDPDNDPNAP
jgi:hypothetical protein